MADRKTGKPLGAPKRFDAELRVYVTQRQYDHVANLAEREERLLSNMVRVLLNEALAARNEVVSGQV